MLRQEGNLAFYTGLGVGESSGSINFYSASDGGASLGNHQLVLSIKHQDITFSNKNFTVNCPSNGAISLQTASNEGITIANSGNNSGVIISSGNTGDIVEIITRRLTMR